MQRRRFTPFVIVLALVGQWSAATSAPAVAADLPSGATLSIVAPPVQIEAGRTDSFADATPGQLIQPGDTVRTGTGGVAVLTFFDGSESQLSTDSQVQVARADYSPAPNIALSQASGVTVNRVIPLPPGGNFETDTPSAIGLVRGTSYVVSVTPAADDADSGVSSAELLTDRDGHVGDVQLQPSD